jgi:hypothetical protein
MLPREMRRLGLSLALILIGAALIGGFLTQVIPPQYVPANVGSLGSYVGTNGSVAGAIFGLGLLWAATNPRANLIWVLLTILYAALLVVYQVYAAAALGRPWELQPIIFGLFGGGLVAALFPTLRRPREKAEGPPAESPESPPPSLEPAPAPASASTPHRRRAVHATSSKEPSTGGSGK